MQVFRHQEVFWSDHGRSSSAREPMANNIQTDNWLLDLAISCMGTFWRVNSSSWRHIAGESMSCLIINFVLHSTRYSRAAETSSLGQFTGHYKRLFKFRKSTSLYFTLHHTHSISFNREQAFWRGQGSWHKLRSSKDYHQRSPKNAFVNQTPRPVFEPTTTWIQSQGVTTLQ